MEYLHSVSSFVGYQDFAASWGRGSLGCAGGNHVAKSRLSESDGFSIMPPGTFQIRGIPPFAVSDIVDKMDRCPAE